MCLLDRAARDTGGGASVRYCGRQCQVRDWWRHKHECGQPRLTLRETDSEVAEIMGIALYP